MKRTGVFVTETEKKKLVKLALEAQSTPAFGLTSEQCLSGDDFSSMAWKRFYEVLNAVAKKHKVPKTVGEYGFDGTNGEFLTA